MSKVIYENKNIILRIIAIITIIIPLLVGTYFTFESKLGNYYNNGCDSKFDNKTFKWDADEYTKYYYDQCYRKMWFARGETQDKLHKVEIIVFILNIITIGLFLFKKNKIDKITKYIVIISIIIGVINFWFIYPNTFRSIVILD